MDFSLSEEQLDYSNRVISFAQRNLNNDVISSDREGRFSKDKWMKCAEFGIQALATPADFGGAKKEIDLLDGILAMESLGYGCLDNGLPFALNDQMWTVQLPIAEFGSDEQKQKYLPKLTNGEIIGAHALTEAEAGSDAFNLNMTAEKTEGGYLLNGQKCLVSLAPIADISLVFANTDPHKGKWGVTSFIVEKDTPGLISSPVQEKMGLRTVPIGELDFQDCFVPDECRLGKEGAGFSISSHSLEYERCSIFASQLGAMKRQLEQTIDRARETNRFGQPIGKFQSVSNKIADMRLRLETSRLLLYKAAWLKSTKQSALLESAMLKLHISESFLDSSLDAIRINGGQGYLTENGVERDLRDAIGGVLYAGTSDIQRNIIARLLRL